MEEPAQRVDLYPDREKGILVRCPECGEFYGMYDHSPERVYRHLNTRRMETYIHVRPPRAYCPRHGVKQIDSEAGENGSDMTYAFESMVLRVAEERSIEATARLCGLSWDRSGNALERYYRQFRKEELAGNQSVAMDMWDPYIAATKAHVPEAEKKSVFDRFPIMKHMLTAVDEGRKREHRELSDSGEETLKGTRYLWLWSRETIPQWRQDEFESLRTKDLKVCRAWAIMENLRHLWESRYAEII